MLCEWLPPSSPSPNSTIRSYFALCSTSRGRRKRTRSHEKLAPLSGRQHFADLLSAPAILNAMCKWASHSMHTIIVLGALLEMVRNNCWVQRKYTILYIFKTKAMLEGTSCDSRQFSHAISVVIACNSNTKRRDGGHAEERESENFFLFIMNLPVIWDVSGKPRRLEYDVVVHRCTRHTGFKWQFITFVFG